MKIRKFNIMLMLIAGIIVTFFSLIQSYSLEQLTFTLVTTLLVFFLIGSVIQYLINRIAEQPQTMKMKNDLEDITQSKTNEETEEK